MDPYKRVIMIQSLVLVGTLAACVCGYVGSRKRMAIPLLLCIGWTAYRCVINVKNLVMNGLHAVSIGGSFYSGTMGNYLPSLLHISVIVLCVVCLIRIFDEPQD